jgi:hypothetical protein
VEHDRLVVGVPNPSPDVDARIPQHRLPPPRLRSRVAGENPLVHIRCYTVGVAGANVNGLPSRPIAELSPVWLAVAPAKRLVPQHQALIHVEAGDGQEEPFALAAVGGVLATVASLCTKPLASLGSLVPRWARSPPSPGEQSLRERTRERQQRTSAARRGRTETSASRRRHVRGAVGVARRAEHQGQLRPGPFLIAERPQRTHPLGLPARPG